MSRRRKRGKNAKRPATAKTMAGPQTPGAPKENSVGAGTADNDLPPVAVTAHYQTESVKQKLLWLLVGTVLGAALGAIGQWAIQAWHEWYFRSQLEVRYSVSTLLTSTNPDGDEFHNYALLVDSINRCSIVGYGVTQKLKNLKPWGGIREVFLKILVINNGRSRATNIRFSIEANDQQTEVEATPNLSVDSIQTTSATGIESRVVTIREIPPGVMGVVTMITTIKEANLKVVAEPGGKFFYSATKDLDVGRLNLMGSDELGGAIGLSPLSAAEMLWRESQIYGYSDVILVPFVRSSKLGLFAGQDIPVGLDIQDVFSDRCAFPPSAPRKFSVKMSVNMNPVQSGVSNNK